MGVPDKGKGETRISVLCLWVLCLKEFVSLPQIFDKF